MNKKTINEALEYAVDALINLSRLKPSPRERFPQESQVQCALYDYFKNKKQMNVHPEASYQPYNQGENNNAKCDLRVLNNKKETWIEIKITSHGSEKGNANTFNNSPKKYYNRWLVDVKRLQKLPSEAEKVFILVGLFDQIPQGDDNCFSKCIEELRKQLVNDGLTNDWPAIYTYNEEGFNWGRIENIRIKALGWLWQ
jgi:hypothetical protein